MRNWKSGCVCSCILAVIGTSSLGQTPQTIVFLSVDGEQDAGNHALHVAPGSTLELLAFVTGNVGPFEWLSSYTVGVDCEATGGLSGSVTHIEETLEIDTTRVDWAFYGGNATYGPATLTDCPDFAMAATAFVDPGVTAPVPESPKSAYMAEWTFDVSADACGEFSLAFVSPDGLAGGSALGSVTPCCGIAGCYCDADWQTLTIVAGIAPDVDRYRSGSECEGSSMFGFGAGDDGPRIPADFFGPGTDSFVGEVFFHSATRGGGIEVERPETFCVTVDAPNAQAPTRVAKLDLVGCSPIQVTGKSAFAGAWSVRVELSPTVPPDGTLDATLDQPDSGTFTATLNVQPLFTFTKIDSPNRGTVVQLDTALAGTPPIALATIEPAPFLVDGTTFEPGMVAGQSWIPCCVETCYESANQEHRQCFRPNECRLVCTAGVVRQK